MNFPNFSVTFNLTVKNESRVGTEIADKFHKKSNFVAVDILENVLKLNGRTFGNN